ncbi:hypothetical protein ACFV22_19925 [Kitasatospora purpeofusca]|uniref:hypothetical protein n=1 Tax=Kitasatospora purpeofusca TaxID=67352 RepID=UPI00368D4CFF
MQGLPVGSRRSPWIPRALPITTTDPNGRTVTQAYDALGRLKAVWTPGRATNATADRTFDYAVNGTPRLRRSSRTAASSLSTPRVGTPSGPPRRGTRSTRPTARP